MDAADLVQDVFLRAYENFFVIPCHRMIAADGSLGGYRGGAGLSAKRWLLRLERASV